MSLIPFCYIEFGLTNETEQDKDDAFEAGDLKYNMDTGTSEARHPEERERTGKKLTPKMTGYTKGMHDAILMCGFIPNQTPTVDDAVFMVYLKESTRSRKKKEYTIKSVAKKTTDYEPAFFSVPIVDPNPKNKKGYKRVKGFRMLITLAFSTEIQTVVRDEDGTVINEPEEGSVSAEEEISFVQMCPVFVGLHQYTSDGVGKVQVVVGNTDMDTAYVASYMGKFPLYDIADGFFRSNDGLVLTLIYKAIK